MELEGKFLYFRTLEQLKALEGLGGLPLNKLVLALVECEHPLKSGRRTASENTKYIVQRMAYEKNLDALSDKEILGLYKEKKRALEAEKLALGEQLAWWERPSNVPDYDFWLAKDLWSPEEAILLSLGLSPKKVKYKDFIKEPPYNNLPKMAKERGELIVASVEAGKLASIRATKYHPKEFVEWLSAKRLKYPDELSVFLEKNEEPICKSENLGAGERQKLNETIGLLVMYVAEVGQSNLKNGDKPNQSVIADKLIELINSRGLDLTGHAKSTLSGRFKAGLNSIGF